MSVGLVGADVSNERCPVGVIVLSGAWRGIIGSVWSPTLFLAIVVVRLSTTTSSSAGVGAATVLNVSSSDVNENSSSVTFVQEVSLPDDGGGVSASDVVVRVHGAGKVAKGTRRLS